MNLSVGAKTDPGRRPNNEDQLAVVDVRRLRLRADAVLVIADGMGGRNFGERAASTAVEAVQDTLTEMLLADRAEPVNVSDALDSALRKANARVYEVAAQTEDSRGMGTTLVAAVVEGDRLYLAHAGDSRAYLLRGQQLVRLTDDHSYVAEQVRAGTLSEESARRSRFRNVITRAVGIEPTITPDLGEHDVQAGDWLLLCTDGLSNMVAEPEIVQTLTHVSSAQDAADRLVQIANRNGGRDNITAIVARLEAGNRTQRMRKSDLAKALPVTDELETGKPAASTADNETPTVQPTAPRPASDPRPSAQPARPSRGLIAALVIAVLLGLTALAAALTLARILNQNHYRLQASPPFAVKPLPPPVPVPPDISHVTYDAPVLFSPIPVQGEFLTLSPGDGAVTALSVSGQVVRFSANGALLFKYPLPPRPPVASTGGKPPLSPPLAASPAPSPKPPAQSLYWASDRMGNLYSTDPVQHTLRKYAPNGKVLGAIAIGLLKHPEAVAVGTDGAIYVVDAQRLKVIRPRPVAGNFLYATPAPGT